MRLAQAMRKRKRRERLNWFPPAEAALKRTLIQNLISVLLRSRPPGVSPVAWIGEDNPSDISIAPLNFASLSSPSSLANSRTFLVGIWRIIKDLAWFALAMVPGWRRRVLFLIRLKNRKIFSLRFLCFSYNHVFCSVTRSAIATVPGWRRRVLFLVRLKNMKIFSLRFLCPSRNAHDSGGIFSSRKWKKLGTPTEF